VSFHGVVIDVDLCGWETRSRGVGLVLPGTLLATVVGAVALALRRLRTMPLTMTLSTGE